MKIRIVDLANDYPGKISSFAEARNYFLEQLANGEYAFFIADDEEIPRMLLSKIEQLPGLYPYYWVRRIQLLRDKYVPAWNPHFESQLCSNRVRFYGRVHEHVTPRDPHGIIDIPVIHNQVDGRASYTDMVPAWMHSKWYQSWMAVKKVVEVARGR